MAYSKPTIEVLGEAVALIQGGKSVLFFLDPWSPDFFGLPNTVPPAYELDE
jgi:hypothetical protein